MTAGSMPRASAQASVSAGVWQQQLEKHFSAVSQPQALSMQGNGVERSLPAMFLAAAECAGGGPNGSGNPEATKPYSASIAHVVTRRNVEAAFMQPGTYKPGSRV